MVYSAVGSVRLARQPSPGTAGKFRSMLLSPGTRLGPYEIVGAIGAGGMGEVYRARDTRLDRTVAIKVLPPNRSRATPRCEALRARGAERSPRSTIRTSARCYDVGSQDGIGLPRHGASSRAKRSPTGWRAPRRQVVWSSTRFWLTASRSPTRSTARTGTASSIAISSRAT